MRCVKRSWIRSHWHARGECSEGDWLSRRLEGREQKKQTAKNPSAGLLDLGVAVQQWQA